MPNPVYTYRTNIQNLFGLVGLGFVGLGFMAYQPI